MPRSGCVLLQYLTTDPEILGVLAWVGLLTTFVGFVIAILQLRKIQSATQAARSAVSQMTIVVRSHEQSAKLHIALDNLKLADDQLRKGNGDAAAAYLSAGWQALLDTRELTDGESGREMLDDYVVVVRRMYDDVRSPIASPLSAIQRTTEQIIELSKVLNNLGAMASKVRVSLSGIGVVNNESD